MSVFKGYNGPHRFLALLVFLAVIVSVCKFGVLPVHAAGVTHYVSYSLGNDTNNGTSKATPWKHAPGMLGVDNSNNSTGDGCSANCAGYTPQPGDTFYLYGGDIWPYTAVPWFWTWPGSGTTSTYGCTGTGCITITYDPTWNKGIVNSVTLTQQYVGNCNPSSPPTVSFSGGGGSGAAATALVIPAVAGTAEPNVAGFIYHVTVTNQGSGYTSDPTVTISGGGCTVSAVADIYRPVIDLGGNVNLTGYTWNVGQGPNFGIGLVQPGFTDGNQSHNPDYLIVDGMEIRNLQQQARWSSASGCVVNGGTLQTGMLWDYSGGHDTFTNNYVHGRFTNCNVSAAVSQQAADFAIGFAGYDEVSNNVMENGDSYFTANGTNGCANCPSIFSESELQGGGAEAQHNIAYSIRWMGHTGGIPPTPAFYHDNREWLVLYDVGGAHVNEQYAEYGTGVTYYNYNNIFHSAVSGASNQQQMSNNTNQWWWNDVSWGLGGGTSNYGIDGVTSAGSGNTFHFYNNTMYGENGTRDCFDDNSAHTGWLTVLAQNNHCITTANPYFANGGFSTYQNYAGNTSPSVVNASSTVQSASTATTQGYTQANGYAPTSSINDTVTFVSSANSANLTSLCTGYLVSLCSDINGNQRPSSGGWQSGAYFYGSGAGGGPPAAPTGLTATVE